jgi:peptidoglycan L-alanyl-D-glutamate endopeptidase CwlK
MPAWTHPYWSKAGDDAERWTQDRKWESLDSWFAVPLHHIFEGLEHDGFDPEISVGWRTSGEQAALVKKGRSRVPWSYHEAVSALGHPAAVAADVIDRRAGWGTKRITDPRRPDRKIEVEDPTRFPRALAFFKALGRRLHAAGLNWGGDFSVEPGTIWGRHGIGWDPAHAQGPSNDALSAWRKASENAQRRALAWAPREEPGRAIV